MIYKMDTTKILNTLIITLSSLATMSNVGSSQSLQCEEFVNQEMFTLKHDTALVYHLLKTLTVDHIIQCLAHCVEQEQCMSVNYTPSPTHSIDMKFQCELNHAASEQSVINSFIRRPGTVYYALPKKALNVFVSSEGFQDSTYRGHAIVKVNNKDYSKNLRGFNFVVIDGETGCVEESMFFDTHASVDQTNKMIDFLQQVSSKPNKIVIAAVKDDAQYRISNEAYTALSKLTGTRITPLLYRSSLALIEYSAPTKPSFVKYVQNERTSGPSEIKKTIYVPL